MKSDTGTENKQRKLKNNLKFRYWLGMVNGVIAIIINCCIDYYANLDQVELIKVLSMMLFSVIAFILSANNTKTSIDSKKYGNTYVPEALLYFENNPCEITYIDSMGRTWNSGYFDD